MNLERQIARLGALRCTAYELHDGPNGRVLRAAAEDAADVRTEATEELYDVVTIGGWGMTIAGDPNGWETVNDFFGEKNHIFAARQTRAEVEAGAWTWGRGSTENHFAIAAIVHGTRGLIPNFEQLWWNAIVPERILRARAIDENYRGRAVTLTLTIGDIG